MGLKSVSTARKPSLAWFEGTNDGRPFALRIIGKYAGRGIENRRTYITVLRVAVAVNTGDLPGYKVKFDNKSKTINVYDVEQGLNDNELLQEQASTAFWKFVHTGYPVGFEDGDLRFSSGTRELVFGERNALDSPYLFGDTVLVGARAVLVHDHVRPNRTADQVRMLLGEMNKVAEAFETNA